MGYKSEFNDFDWDLPESLLSHLGWHDTSWHNDAMPSWELGATERPRFRIWFNHKRPELREIEGAPLIAVYAYKVNSPDLYEELEDEPLLETDEPRRLVEWVIRQHFEDQKEARVPLFNFKRQTVREYVEWLIASGMTYHFDDDPETINWPDWVGPADLTRLRINHERLHDVVDIWQWFTEQGADLWDRYTGSDLPASMSFDEFAKTGVHTTDIGGNKLVQDVGLAGVGGVVFAEGLYIEWVKTPGEDRLGYYMLTLGNEQFQAGSGDLSMLARKLYDWARSEGYFDAK